MMRYRRFAVVLTLLTGVGIVGTSAGDISGTGDKNEFRRFGLLSFLFKDAPVDDAQAVVLTVTGLELLGNGGVVKQSYAINPPKVIDVLQLQGNVTETLLDGVAAPVGSYQQLRLLVDTPPSDCQNLIAPFDSYVDVDGTQYPLVLPANSQAGLTFRGDVAVSDGGSADYLIDLDLRQALVSRGQTGCYTLRPALRLAAIASSGSVVGEVEADFLTADHCASDAQSGAGAAVYAFAGRNVRPSDIGPGANGPLATATLARSETNSDFIYELGYLPQGDYTLALSCQAALDDVEAKDRLVFDAQLSVSVVAGQATQADFSLSP